MAHKKAGGSTNNGRDSNPNMYGVKKYGGEAVSAGNIIVRQRGTKFHPGNGVGIGRDHTIYSLIDGKVNFKTGRKNRTFINVDPLTDEEWAGLGLPPREEAAPKAKKVKKAAPSVKEEE